MSKEFIYSSEDHQSLINDDVPEVWSENDQSSLQYFDANNTTLNETYASALGTNETQYLSILDNTDENLDDLHNLTINAPSNGTANSSLTQEDDDAENVPITNSDDDDNEIVVFTMEGSDELYGLQLSHDADGSIKKYQFKFRTTEQGQLEPIPETVTLLSNENLVENLNMKQESSSSEPECSVNISNIKLENNIDDISVQAKEPFMKNIENILITKVRTSESEPEEPESEPINNNEESIKLEEINSEEEIAVDETLCEEPEKQKKVCIKIEKTLLEPVEKVDSADINRNVQNLQEATKDVQNEVKFYIVYHQKENVKTLSDKNLNILESSKSETIHPRSVLKTTVNKLKNAKKETDRPPESDMFHKRFAKNKDAMRAKHFHNFLKRTTITHAPIRNQRQPRKQEIKPIDERSREEIIVQQVVISSEGFIESTRKNNEWSTVVELSDSEAESTEYTKTLRSGRTFGPSCEKNIIEINSDIEETVKSGPLKRCRGRPPKTSSCKIDTTKTKIELICPHCTKTFPSQNSLNTHIKHHNLEKRLKSRISTMNSALKSSSSNVSIISKTTQYNYQCEICQERFINKILLQRHKCTKITENRRKLNCAVCLKTFGDVVMLNIHKKSHLKANLMNTTCSVKVTPRRKTVSPKRKIVNLKTTTFKCNECSKVCDSALILSMHQKTHKKFLCNSCAASFTSKMLLDLHVRCNCVKFKTTNRASFMLPNKKISCTQQQSPRNSLNNKSSILGVKLECDKCLLKFNTFRNLYTHKVEKHGLDTPDKSLLLTKPKKSLYKPRPVFGGIPANDRLKKAYANIRQKLAESSTNNLRID